jgi:hypothetical protein
VLSDDELLSVGLEDSEDEDDVLSEDELESRGMT